MKHRQVFVLVGLPIAVMVISALALIPRGPSTSLVPVALAQTSSCGNAFLDPGEQCDPPGSLTCPGGSPGGAMLPCNADCQCPQPSAALDHFQCYALKPRQF